MKKYKKGQTVIVHDRYRFAKPLKAVVVEFNKIKDAVRVQLLESNSKSYPVGCDDVWVSVRQLEKFREYTPAPTSAPVIKPLSEFSWEELFHYSLTFYPFNLQVITSAPKKVMEQAVELFTGEGDTPTIHDVLIDLGYDAVSCDGTEAIHVDSSNPKGEACELIASLLGDVDPTNPEYDKARAWLKEHQS